MPPTVVLIRHGQAVHNINNDWEIFDPALTEEGKEQCRVMGAEVESKFDFPKGECLMVVSPLTRTLETMQIAFPWLHERGIPVEVRAEWQETTANPCDMGSEPEKIKKGWPEYDFSHLDPVYPEKTGLYGASEEKIRERAEVVKRWLYNRPEKYIFVVTHSGFLKRLVVGGSKFKNTEYRTYRLVEKWEGGLELREFGDETPLIRG